MSETALAPAPSGTPVVPAAPASISEASRALREAPPVVEPVAETPVVPAGEPVVPTVETGEQPRNPDGTFAPKAPQDAPAGAQEPEQAAPEGEAAPEGDAGADAPTDAPEEKLFVLKGEEQRGESDLELDVTGLPPEAVERLERLAKQGMRRAEYDNAMRRVHADRANLDAVETELAVDPQGFLLNRVAPATRKSVAETLLLEQFEELAPMIEVLWNDPLARRSKLDDVKAQIASKRGEVTTSISAARQAAEIRSEISGLIPDNVSDADAQEFFATSIALMQQQAMQNASLTSADVPKLLAAHRRRFFGAGPADAPPPPARPRLAVKTTPSAGKPAAAPSAPKTVVSADEIAARQKARTAALAVAPQGAGPTAVTRDPGPANETIEQRSRRLRAAG